MTNEITTSKTFQEKMFERIRDQMGDLMTDDDLKKIVEVAAQKAFFEERISHDRYGSVIGKKPSEFIEMMGALLREQVQEQAKAFFESHKDEVIKQIDETLAKGFFELVQQHMRNQIYVPLANFQSALAQKGILI